MNCPYCGHIESRVIDSRDASDGIRRRRQCCGCGNRFTTYERPQEVSMVVLKKDGRREEFNRDKLETGIRRACEKRPLPEGTIESFVAEIETGLYRLGKAEIPAATIGDMVIEGLRELDHIAYIRFASVYHGFADVTAMKEELDNLLNDGQESRRPVNQLPLLPPESGSRSLPSTSKGGHRR